MADAVILVLEPALPAAAQWRGDGVAIAPVAQCARWSLRLPQAAAERLREIAGFRIAIAINRSTYENDQLAARLGPDEWLLCAPVDAAAESERVLTAALAGEPHALVDVGHRYAALAIDGPQAPMLIASGCPLDLHPAAFAAGTAPARCSAKPRSFSGACATRGPIASNAGAPSHRTSTLFCGKRRGSSTRRQHCQYVLEVPAPMRAG